MRKKHWGTENSTAKDRQLAPSLNQKGPIASSYLSFPETHLAWTDWSVDGRIDRWTNG